MNSRSRLLLVVFLSGVFAALVVLAGCSVSTPESAPNTASEPTPPATEGDSLYTPAYLPNGDERAVITTSKGAITVALLGDEAPVHVGNFVELARKGFYDSTKFHRRVEGFVVQGGDPNTVEYSSDQVTEMVARQGAGDIKQGEKILGTGGPGYAIKAEYAQNTSKHVEGALAMARSQSPDSAGSQFYFALEALPQLDGQYTVFGVITEGLDVMHQLGIGDEILTVEILDGAE